MKKILGGPYLLMMTLLLVSCSIENKQSHLIDGLRLETQSINLSHEDYLLGSHPALNKIVGFDSLLTLDVVSNALVLFDMNSQKALRKIQLEKEGPNFFEGYILDADIVGQNLLTLGDHYFTISSLDGTVKFREKVSELDSIFPFRPLGFSRIDNESILLSKWPESAMFANKRDNRRVPIFAVYNWSKGEYRNLPIYAPEEALLQDSTKGFFEGLSRHSFIKLDSKVIFSFKFSSKIYLYDLKDSALKVSQGEFVHIPNIREAFPSNQIRDVKATTNYLYNGVQFSDIAYDEKNKRFVRVGSEYITNEDGTNNDVRYLMLLDQNLNKIEEFMINDKIFDKPIVSNGITYFISGGGQLNEGEYQLRKYEITNN